jgi:Protein of unknown function (DUF3040)
MSLDAWEQRALDSIKDGLTGSDPELAALLSAFTRLASGEEGPDGEEIQPRSRRALRRLRRARWCGTFRRVCRRLGFQGVAALLCLLTTATVIAVTLVLNVGGDHAAPCIEWVAAVCTSPAAKHGSVPTSHDPPTSQPPRQRAVSTREAGPKALRDEPTGSGEASHNARSPSTGRSRLALPRSSGKAVDSRS